MPTQLMLSSHLQSSYTSLDFSLLASPSASPASIISCQGCLATSAVAAHHLFLGLTLTLLLPIVTASRTTVYSGPTAQSPIVSAVCSSIAYTKSTSIQLFDTLLWIMLALVGSLTLFYAYSCSSLNAYPFLGTVFSTTLCNFKHHQWIGSILLAGGVSHCCIACLSSSITSSITTALFSNRDTVTGHLVWVTLFLGFHSFGLYIHNDSIYGLSRPACAFGDHAIKLVPLLSREFAPLNTGNYLSDFILVDTKIVWAVLDLGTSDFLVHYIHAFTIHTLILISVKGTLYCRSSRLITDKYSLGFRYPCDGPGRGGTCQVSGWDHTFLNLFWVYNCISIVIFHFLWKISSDLLGTIDFSSSSSSSNGYQSYTYSLYHAGSSDYSTNGTYINGWLRNFLWSKVVFLIQAYGSYNSSYIFLFLACHFVFAFSLMFLFSGRGYWQELIESITWAHSKIALSPSIDPYKFWFVLFFLMYSLLVY
jgi:photosystem I P700 chlorophyll a apoprotein A1